MNTRILAQRKAMVARNPEYYACHIGEIRRHGRGIVHFSLYTGFTWTAMGKNNCPECRELIRELIRRKLAEAE